MVKNTLTIMKKSEDTCSRVKTIKVESLLPTDIDSIWDKLQYFTTLKYIAKPYIDFVPLDNETIVWQENEVFYLKLKLLGFISLGTHTIQVKEFNKDNYTVRTEEFNKYIQVWNHKIVLVKTANDQATHYTDEVTIKAGRLTDLIGFWGKFFYAHRQRKWKKLLIKG